MNIYWIALALVALGLGGPVLMHLYVHRLPVAPACPTCRSVTREVPGHWVALQRIPALATTYIGRCGQCGWQGRLRWRWAPGRAGRRGGAG